MDANLILVVGMTFIFGSPAFILPLIIGLPILIKNRRDLFSQAAALFTLKPILTTPLWALIFGYITSLSTNGANNFTTLLPGVLVTFILVLVFRRLFRTSPGVFTLLLSLDAVRWLNTFIWVRRYFTFPFSPTERFHLEPIFNLNSYAAILLPNLYAVLVLVLVRRRSRRKEPAGEAVETTSSPA